MHWWQYALLGAGGGALVEVLAIFKWFAAWQSARRTPTGRVKGRPPALRTYIDLPVHAWMALFRMMLGAGSATLFGATGQINGVYVAVALGFAAPSMLAQLGNIPQVAAAIADAPKSVHHGGVRQGASQPAAADETGLQGVKGEVVGEG